jgi:hypothetical protein
MDSYIHPLSFLEDQTQNAEKLFSSLPKESPYRTVPVVPIAPKQPKRPSPPRTVYKTDNRTGQRVEDENATRREKDDYDAQLKKYREEERT